MAKLPLLAPYRYTGPIATAIRRLKYEGRAETAARLVRFSLPARAPSTLLDGGLLVPVPAHPLRLVERGYNQSALLARALGSRWRLPVAFDGLYRKCLVSRQVGLSKSERKRNVDGAFVAFPGRISGKSVILMDDVVTTGATATSCCEALEQAGARVVGIVAIAHAECAASSA